MSSWKGWFVSHGSANLERFHTRSWYSTWSYSPKIYSTISLAWMCAKPLFQSNTTARNILVTDYKVRYFPARSRFTHSLCSLYNSDWSQLRLPELMFVDPVRMKSSPGSGGVRNVVPVAIVSYIASDRNPLRYLYVPPLLLDGIYAYFSFIVYLIATKLLYWGSDMIFVKHTMWEAGDHFLWGWHSNGHLRFDAVAMSLVG